MSCFFSCSHQSTLIPLESLLLPVCKSGVTALIYSSTKLEVITEITSCF